MLTHTEKPTNWESLNYHEKQAVWRLLGYQQTIFDTMKSWAYNLGRHHFHDFLQPDGSYTVKCPYLSDTEEARDWQKGFDNAEMAHNHNGGVRLRPRLVIMSPLIHQV